MCHTEEYKLYLELKEKLREFSDFEMYTERIEYISVDQIFSLLEYVLEKNNLRGMSDKLLAMWEFHIALT